jgi:hypothetical protein
MNRPSNKIILLILIETVTCSVIQAHPICDSMKQGEMQLLLDGEQSKCFSDLSTDDQAQVIRTIANREADKLIPQHQDKIMLLEDEQECALYTKALKNNVENFMRQYAHPQQLRYYKEIGFNFKRCLEDMRSYHKVHWYRADLMRLENIDAPLNSLFNPFICQVDNMSKFSGVKRKLSNSGISSCSNQMPRASKAQRLNSVAHSVAPRGEKLHFNFMKLSLLYTQFLQRFANRWSYLQSMIIGKLPVGAHSSRMRSSL